MGLSSPVSFSASGPAAIASCLSMAILFVGSFYLVPLSVQRLSHDDPRQIKARFYCIALVCCTAPLVPAFWAKDGTADDPGPLEWVGVRLEGLLPALLLPLLLAATLFSGPLVCAALSFRRHRALYPSRAVPLTSIFPNLCNEGIARLRNLVVAPVAEEFVFRSLMAPLLVCAGFSATSIVIGGPIAFGVAHLHHAIGNVRQGMAIEMALLQAMVMLSYTTLFGAFEMFVLLRTGHLVGVILCHSFCNLMGLPSHRWLHREHPLFPYRVLISVSYVTGIIGFCLMLLPATNPSLYGCKLWGLIR